MLLSTCLSVIVLLTLPSAATGQTPGYASEGVAVGFAAASTEQLGVGRGVAVAFALAQGPTPSDAVTVRFQNAPISPNGPTTMLGAPGSSSNPQGSVAEPVNTATGNYYTSHVDLGVPGRGFNFTFTRFYNSQDSYSGPIGVGWTHSYNLRLQISGAFVALKEGDGRQVLFASSDNLLYLPASAGVFDTLQRAGDGSYTLTRRDRTRLLFSSTGALLAISDRNGNTQTLNYGGLNELVSVVDTVGRSFNFAYDATGRISTLTDPAGRVVQYSYDPAGHLTGITDPAGGWT